MTCYLHFTASSYNNVTNETVSTVYRRVWAPQITGSQFDHAYKIMSTASHVHFGFRANGYYINFGT